MVWVGWGGGWGGRQLHAGWQGRRVILLDEVTKGGWVGGGGMWEAMLFVLLACGRPRCLCCCLSPCPLILPVLIAPRVLM